MGRNKVRRGIHEEEGNRRGFQRERKAPGLAGIAKMSVREMRRKVLVCTKLKYI